MGAGERIGDDDGATQWSISLPSWRSGTRPTISTSRKGGHDKRTNFQPEQPAGRVTGDPLAMSARAKSERTGTHFSIKISITKREFAHAQSGTGGGATRAIRNTITESG